jgi:hypothetical protein
VTVGDLDPPGVRQGHELVPSLVMADPADLEDSPPAQRPGRPCGDTPVYQDKLEPRSLALRVQLAEQRLGRHVLVGRGR